MAQASKEFAPSQYIIDEEGNKWRLCVAAAVLNSKNELLIGKRIHGAPDSWQAPQGGVDDAWPEKNKPKESIIDASSRELYEEMGLVVGKHVMLDPGVAKNNNQIQPFRYSTSGTKSWLTRAGFAGQELHWTIYRCIDARGDQNPSIMCDLSGQDGEDAEFSDVKWQPVKDVVASIWEGKRAPYEALLGGLEPVERLWAEMISKVDLSGKWSRDNSLSTGVTEGLVARGLSSEDAQKETEKPYIQSWEKASDSSWIVTTFKEDGVTPRRQLTYEVGIWEETYEGEAVLFGSSAKGKATLQRCTSYVAEPDASNDLPIAHVTMTNGPKGIEESRRYLKDGKLFLRRTFLPKGSAENPFTSTEVFVRLEDKHKSE